MNPIRLAFIGGGNMAGAIFGGLLAQGWPAASITIVEPWDEQRTRIAAAHPGVQLLAQAGPTLGQARIVVWAVKPQSFAEAARDVAPHVGAALQLSVMAGITSAAIARAAATERVVRAMPNTPALIGRGIAGLFARQAFTAEDRAAQLAIGSAESPATLRERVTSKGGTTHAAITALDSAGVKDAFVRALHAARTRAEELGR
jgi:pyrroline-5-carboxylate reductase